MVEFPPPSSGGGVAGVEPAYPSAPERPGFVFPPPRQSSGSVRDAGRYVGEKLREATDKADWAANEVNNVGAVVEDYGNTLDRFDAERVVPWAVPTVAPLSQTINRRADPTFQLSDFMVPNSSVGLSGRTNSANGPEGHSHNLGSAATATNSWSIPRGANIKNRVYLAFITPAVTRAYSQLNFMVSEVTDPCQMDVAVYVVSENRVMSRQVLQSAVSPGLGESVATVTFPTWVATQGSYLAIAWLQHGTGNTRSLLGLDDTPRPLANNVFPRKIAAQVTGSAAALPATIDGTTAVDFGTWFTPYAELSEDVGVDYRSFVDRWGQDAVVSRPWVNLTSVGVYSGRANSSSPTNWVGASGFGTRVSMYDTPMSTDHARIETTVSYVPGNSGANTRNSVLAIRASNDMRSGVGLAVSRDEQFRLIEWSGTNVDADWNSRTVLATIAQTPVVGDQLIIEHNAGVVDVWINSVHHIVAQPVGGPAGAAGRFVGIKAERTGNVLTAYPSPWFGPWYARDLPQSGGGNDGGTGTEG